MGVKMRCGLGQSVVPAFLALAFLALPACTRDDRAGEEWRSYAGSPLGDRYSELAQVDRTNVAQLEVAWRYDTGVGGLQTTPLVVDGRLYGYTPSQTVFALDAATGRELWTFAPEAAIPFAGSIFAAIQQPTRGMTYWARGGDRRLFVSAVNFVYALDPSSGRPIADFGQGGRIDLRENLGRDPGAAPVFLTTPGVIYRDLLIVGFRTSESVPAAPGDIRAYDVRSGALRWSFHTIPRPDEAGHETWPADAWRSAGGANSWAGMAVDEARGLVFAATGSAAPDFYGANRAGDNLYANSLLALDARSGQLRWHFQGVHHDIWDRDFASPPVLLTVQRDGRRVDAVAQASKQGFLFLFDRESGAPLFPIEERAVEASTIPGERSAPTQPYPLQPAPFARTEITEDMLTDRTPAAHDYALGLFRSMRAGPPFMPWSLSQPTLITPGFDGGANWGGQAVDRASGVIYVNANDAPSFSRLTPAPPPGSVSRGQAVYAQHCASCHRLDLAGAPPEIPGLRGVSSRYLGGLLKLMIRMGNGRMQGFQHLSDADLDAVVAYLNDGESGDAGETSELIAEGGHGDYVFGGYNRFLDQDGYPAVAPPWGTLNAIDLNTGAYLWRIPLGEHPELAAAGYGDTGSLNYGGPIVTRGGLVFIGATIYDRRIRAFNSNTGALLWEAELPFAGAATPMTYLAGGRQFVVIAASGARDYAGPQGSAYVAFALPERQ